MSSFIEYLLNIEPQYDYVSLSAFIPHVFCTECFKGTINYLCILVLFADNNLYVRCLLCVNYTSVLIGVINEIFVILFFVGKIFF